MTDQPSYKTDTCEELLDLSRANAQAVVIATAAFLHDSGIPVEAWTGFLGQLFAGAWDPDLELHAGELLDALLTNYRSFGADVISATLEPDRAEAVIAGFPKPELCRELGVDCGLADAYFEAPRPLAERLGLSWSWQRDGVRTRLTVTRSGAG